MVVAAKLPPPLAARPPQPWVAGLAQPPRRVPPSPPPGTARHRARGFPYHLQGGHILPPPCLLLLLLLPLEAPCTITLSISGGGIACMARSFPRAFLLAGASHLSSWAPWPESIMGPTGPTSNSLGAYDGPTSLAMGGCSPCSSFLLILPQQLLHHGQPSPLHQTQQLLQHTSEIPVPCHTHPVIDGKCVWDARPGHRLPLVPVPPQAPAVGAGPPLHAVHARHEGKGTGAGDYLDRVGLGLHLHLWDCGQGRGQVS